MTNCWWWFLLIPFGMGCFVLGTFVGLWSVGSSMEKMLPRWIERLRKWLEGVKPWLPQPELSHWARWKDISPGGSGGFHLGPFIDWESGFINVGLDLGFWSLRLIFEKPTARKGGDA